MRELKFRVWSEEDKEYRTDLNVFRLHDGKIICTSPAYSLEGDRFDAEQYTGLKDRHGKEIYEGDIVVNTYYDDGEMYKVLWVDDSVAFGMESLDDMELYKLPLESLEVIGNIHENPELLEEEE